MTDSRDVKSDLVSRASGASLSSLAIGQGGTDPTDPEVPDAKRRRARRRRQSTVFAVSAVGGLAVIALVLLYRTGRQVTDDEVETRKVAVTPAVAPTFAVGVSALHAEADESAKSMTASPPPAIGSAAASGSPRRGKPPMAPDIMHKPAF
jgi:hypothetical protein